LHRLVPITTRVPGDEAVAVAFKYGGQRGFRCGPFTYQDYGEHIGRIQVTYDAKSEWHRMPKRQKPWAVQ
jgi:hypothetical protein